ncbi:MAG TPA: porin [Acetobacteraceae bacterium]|nr:porin [Acetobacteraceae bacterium]
MEMRKLLLTTAAVLGGTVAIATGAMAQTAASTSAIVGTTAPNSFKVHLDGRINWYAGVESSSADNQFGYKSDPYQFQGYIRLYPGFDAVAANGLKYGVASEIRMPGATFSGASTSPGSTSGKETLYWFQAWGYVGTDELGTLSFGMQNGPTTNFETGTFEGFNDGAWNGDVPGFIPGDAYPDFPFSDVGPLQTGNKIVYMSPTWAGFQFGLSFEPNTDNLWNAQCSVAGSTCNNLSASPDYLDQDRFRNLLDVGAQYTGTFGPVGVQVGGGWVGSQNVNYNGLGTAASPTVAPAGTEYNGLSVGQVGATVTFAGFTVGGNLTYGNQDGVYALQPRGGVNEIAWMGGVQYGIGPWIVGASYFRTNFAGGWTSATVGVARTETDQGIAAGATYTLTPGLAVYLSYLYGQRHQLGYDFYTSDTGTPTGNNTRAQVFALGTVLKW